MYLKLLYKKQLETKETAKEIGNLTGNKFANKVTKKSPQNPSKTVKSKTNAKKRYRTPEERHKIIGELRLI